MVIGDSRKYVTALIGIELETVGDWALRQSIPYTTYRDLSEKEEVIELVSKVVDATNTKFARVSRSRSSGCFPRSSTTRTASSPPPRSSNATPWREMFGDLVESMY